MEFLRSRHLKKLGVSEAANFEQSKKAFRRLAMKWHPDRCAAPDAAERFADVRSAYEALEALQDSGRWDAAAEDSGSKAKPNSAPFAPAKQTRKPWDPPSGPVFDLGYGEEKNGAARCFFSSLMAAAIHAREGGAGAKVAGLSMARGFNALMESRQWAMDDLPMLREHFLAEFWANPLAGAFAVFDNARERLERMGWAQAVYSALDPRADVHGSFYVFEAAGRSIPQAAAGRILAFYREWIAAMPELFASWASNERALRFALFLKGAQRGEFFLKQALEKAPKVAEIFAPLSSPSRFGAKEDWLDLALNGGVDPGALSGWFAEEPLSKLCSKLDRMDPRRAKKMAKWAELKMETEGIWLGAGSWATPRAARLGRAQAELANAMAIVDTPFIVRAKAAMGFSEAEVWKDAVRCALFGKAGEIAASFEAASKAGALKKVLSLNGIPLSAACAMRLFFDPTALDNFKCVCEAIAKHAGQEELLRKEPGGLSGSEWYELAIGRRGYLGS